MRATQRERDRALATLRSATVAGELGTDTFEHRLELALRAKTSLQLRSLVADLPVRGLWRRLSGWLVSDADPTTIIVRLPRPGSEEETFLIGRGSRCQFVIDDPAVSRQHLSLRSLGDGRWMLVDLHSTNGVLVNGWRVRNSVVEAGDSLSVGNTVLELSD